MGIEDRIDELISRPKCQEFTFVFGGYGKPYSYCCCYIDINARQGVYAIATSMEASLDKALQVIDVMRAHNVKFPPVEKQPHDRGYYREMIDEVNQAEYKRFHNRLYLTGIAPPEPPQEIDGGW